MKKIVSVLLIMLFAASMVYAQETVTEDPGYFEDSPFMPKQAEVMGAGGSFVSDSRSYNAMMLGNPAGFAKKPRSLTLLSVNPWVYARPDQVWNVVMSEEGFDPATDALGLVMDQVVDNGIGAGASFGLGWTGGLALGVLGSVDSFVYGKSQLGIQGEAEATVSGLVGLGFPIRFGDNFALLIGGDLRTLYRVKAPLPNAEVLGLITTLTAPEDPAANEYDPAMETEDPVMKILNQLNVMYGYGIAIDLGAMVELGPFTAGLSIRDFANTKMYYDKSSVADFIAAYETEGVPVPEDTGLIGQIPMNVAAGLSFHPDLGWFSYILDPRVYADFNDVLGYFSDEGATVYRHLNAGAEVKLLSLVRARAGFNQGYVTAGVGVKLLFAEVNASFFTEELGDYVGDQPRSGVSLEAAIRF